MTSTPHSPRSFATVAGATAVALLLAACSSNTDSDAGETTPTTPESTPVVTEPPATEPPATEPPATGPAPTEPAATTPPATEAPPEPPPTDPAPALALSFERLPLLGAASIYEGWAIIDGAAISTGRFLVDDGGSLVDESGAAADSFAIDATAASAFVLTIEPFDDPDPAPSEVHLLAGDIVDGVADLTIDHPAALGTDFSEVSGSVEVAVPTARGLAGAETAGAWFFSEGSGSLTLPVLPAGWVYEGWVLFDGIPTPTGRFTDPNMADDFNGFSGDGSGPATPGEDFIRNAPDGLEFPRSVAGETVVVSVEPDPDDSPLPFALKPLVGQIAPDAGPLTEHTLMFTGTADFPIGRAVVSS